MPYSKSIAGFGGFAASGREALRAPWVRRRSAPGIRATRVPEPTTESRYPSATSCS